MGNSLNLNSKLKGLLLKTKTANSQIGEVSYCPNCQIQFSKTTTYQTFDNHVEACLMTQQRVKKPKAQQFYEVYIKSSSKQKQITKMKEQNQKQEEKWTKYLVSFDELLLHMTPKDISKRNTAQKIIWFHHRLGERKIDWKKGAQQLIFSHHSIITDSLLVLKLNLFKELKLTVVDDIVKDAGGLLREWSVLVLKSLISDYGLFESNKQGYYRLKPNEQVDELYELVGAILAKVMLQKITIPIKFDHTFLSLLRAQIPKLEDVQTFDKGLFSSWKQVIEYENIEEMQLTFSILADNSVEELLPNGESIKVTNKNKNLFVQRCIDHYCVEKVQRQMDLIKKKFNQYIDLNDIQVFSSQELEMMINGVDSQNINLQDWKKGTQYREPYSEDHKVIKWFWNIVALMNPKERGRLLKFVTGSQNLPIFGFKNLQTNRGKTSPFVIEGCKYDKKKSFPKAHTCFNRLILPVYPNQQALAQSIFPVIRSEFDGVWGLQ